METKYLAIFLFIFALTSCGNTSEKEYFLMKKKYHLALDEFVIAYNKAVSEEEIIAASGKFPDRDTYIMNLYVLATEKEKRRYVADVWSELYNTACFVNDSIFETTIDVLIEHHTKSDYLTSIDPILLWNCNHKRSEEFIQKVLEENPNQKVKAIFLLAQARKYTHRKTSDFYNLEDGLEIFDLLKQKYGALEIEYHEMQEPTKQTTIAEIADNAIFLLTTFAIGNKIPELTSKDLEGNEVNLSTFSGNVIVLDIWATWCGPCIKMIPHLTNLSERLKNEPFQLISISVDRDVSMVHEFQQKIKMPWVNWYDGRNGEITTRWGINRYPNIFIIDKQGIIRHRSSGSMTDIELDSLIDNLL